MNDIYSAPLRILKTNYRGKKYMLIIDRHFDYLIQVKTSQVGIFKYKKKIQGTMKYTAPFSTKKLRKEFKRLLETRKHF